MERQKYNYQACRVEFSLLTDLVILEPIRFDSLLASLWYASNYNVSGASLPAPEDLPIPVRKLKVNGQWFWDCSHSTVDVKFRQQDTLKKNIDNLNGLLRVDCGSGPYCSIFKKFERLTCNYVQFFVYGNLIELKKIVKMVSSLGGLRKDGFGWVKNVKIEPCNMDFCSWDSSSGLLLRDIPANQNNFFEYMGESGLMLRRGRCRPPYFKRYAEGQLTLIASGSEIKEFPSMVETL